MDGDFESENVLPGGIGRVPAGLFYSVFYFSNVFSTVVARAPIFSPPGLVTLIHRHHSVQFLSLLLLLLFPAKNKIKKAENKGE